MTRFRHYPDAEDFHREANEALSSYAEQGVAYEAKIAAQTRDAADTGYAMEDGVLRRVSLTEKGSQS